MRQPFFSGLIVHVEFHVWHINQSIYLTYDEIKFTQKKTQTNLVCNEILFIMSS